MFMELKTIGIIHSPYKEKGDAPPQGRMNMDLFEVEIFEDYIPGLKDIETATHLIMLYWCDRAGRDILIANTPWDSEPHGVFATRSPQRPNPIAFDIVDLVEKKANILVVKGMDALDKSPLLDIKPYNAHTDSIPDAKLGWFDKAKKKEEE
ncbi:MAG: S-adenosyl-L-methionine-binding protein [Peptococcaceae bacterium BICA1-8]|nr:MAG: S-adenosyl-L-methionine-binding protein [Peptococcaceae bacterium BICA1-8]